MFFCFYSLTFIYLTSFLPPKHFLKEKKEKKRKHLFPGFGGWGNEAKRFKVRGVVRWLNSVDEIEPDNKSRIFDALFIYFFSGALALWLDEIGKNLV